MLAQYSRQTVCGALIRGALTLVLLAIPVCGWLFGSATATAADEGEECVNAEVRKAQRAEFLPDCRAYEKVSPNAKGNLDVHGDWLTSSMRASVDGDGLVYSSNGAFPGAVRNGSLPYSYLATRTEAGWESVGLNPPATSTRANAGSAGVGNTGQVLAVSPGLERAIVASNSAIDENGELVPDLSLATNLFAQDNPGSNFELLTPGAPSGPEVATATQYYLYLADATEDLSHAVISTAYAMTPDASNKPLGGSNLYEYGEGQLRLVSVDPLGQAIPGAVELGDDGGDILLRNFRQNAISADGSRIFFDAQELGGGQIHVRIDGERTVQIPNSREFYAADPAGERAVYGRDGAISIFDVDTQTVTDVVNPCPSDCAFVTASQDLDRIYFVHGAALLPGQDPLPAGTLGLYLWEEGDLRFIASVEPTVDSFNFTRFLATGGTLRNRSLAVSADGSRLAFVAGGEVNGVDTGHYNAYLYEAEADELVCMSCPDGEPKADPEDPALLWGGVNHSGGSPYASDLHEPYVISANGSRVFFHTAESLVPRDTNGKYDVYVWQDGEPHLISSGKGRYDARFVDADPSGDNVFFATRNQLVASDDDEYVDIYVARVGGGFAEQEADPGCQGDSCQDPPTGAPPDPAPGSSEFQGPGNPKAEPRDCSRLERNAAAAKREAKQARRKAGRARRRAADASDRRATRLRERAERLERRAKRLSHRAAQKARRAEQCKRGAA